MSNDLPVAWLVWHDETAWSLTGRCVARTCKKIKDPQASDMLYITALAAPFTGNTMPEGTVNALARDKTLDASTAEGGGDCEDLLARLSKAGKEAKGVHA